MCVFKQSLKNVAEDENIRHGHIIFLNFFIIIIRAATNDYFDNRLVGRLLFRLID